MFGKRLGEPVVAARPTPGTLSGASLDGGAFGSLDNIPIILEFIFCVTPLPHPTSPSSPSASS